MTHVLGRYQLEREMSKAGIIRGNYAMDVVYPSIAIGMAYGTVTAFLVSALVLGLIDLLFLAKPHFLWRSGMLVVVLAGLFLFFLRETPLVNRNLLWIFLASEVVLAILGLYFDLLSYRLARREYQRFQSEDESILDQQDLLRANKGWSRSNKILNMLIATIILVFLAGLWFDSVQGVFVALALVSLVLFLVSKLWICD